MAYRRNYYRRGPRRQAGGWWVAKTTDRPENPQRCGLSNRPLIGTDTVDEEQASVCFFLVTKGSEPLPLAQIEISRKEDEYSTGYRAVPTGEYIETTGKGGRTWRRPVFKHQELLPSGEWHDIETWSRAVLVEEAEARGFRVPAGLCKSGGHKGERTLGAEHRVGKADSPLEQMIRHLDGEVDPSPVPVDEPPPE